MKADTSPPIILKGGLSKNCAPYRRFIFLMYAFTKDEMLSMLLKSKGEFQKILVEKLKGSSDEMASDAYSSSSTRLSGQSSKDQDEKETQELPTEAPKTVDAVGCELAVDQALRQSAGHFERQNLIMKRRRLNFIKHQ